MRAGDKFEELAKEFGARGPAKEGVGGVNFIQRGEEKNFFLIIFLP